jgi:hypothetical protein
LEARIGSRSFRAGGAHVKTPHILRVETLRARVIVNILIICKPFQSISCVIHATISFFAM